jgi:hypothetical protein
MTLNGRQTAVRLKPWQPEPLKYARWQGESWLRFEGQVTFLSTFSSFLSTASPLLALFFFRLCQFRSRDRCTCCVTQKDHISEVFYADTMQVIPVCTTWID